MSEETPQTSSETQTQPPKEEESKTKDELGGEQSDTDKKEDDGKENPPEEEKTDVPVDDYLASDTDNTSKSDDNWKKRYEDSSREAQRIKEDLDSFIGFIKSDPELLAMTQKKAGLQSTTTEGVPSQSVGAVYEKYEELSKKIGKIERKELNEITRKFEQGKNLTPEDRKEIGAFAKELQDKINVPWGEALELSWVKYGKKGSVVENTTSNLEGRIKENQDATYKTSNSSVEPGSQPIKLTEKEQMTLNKLAKTPEAKQKLLKKLLELRKEREDA